MKLSLKDLSRTVDILADEWHRIGRTNGTLPSEEMIESMIRAKRRGLPVSLVRTEASLIQMQHLLIGEIVLEN